MTLKGSPNRTEQDVRSAGPRTDALNRSIVLGARFLLGLRYRVAVRRLDEVRSRGTERILFLPNHAALIDPVILTALLYPDFAPRALADEERIGHPAVRWLARRFGVYPLPSVESSGRGAVPKIKSVLDAAAQDLRRGCNLLIYPAGRLKRCRREEIRAAGAVDRVLERVPEARVVLVRHAGLWGSSFSWAFTGRSPELAPNLKRGAGYLLFDALFFMPRRRVEIEFVEPTAFSSRAPRGVRNRLLEDFYNEVAGPNTYVPYVFWRRGGAEERPDPHGCEDAGR